MQQATITPIHLRENRVTEGHGTGIEDAACNDEHYQQEDGKFTLVMSVLANLVGGSVLLSAMFFLPHLIGYLLS